MLAVQVLMQVLFHLNFINYLLRLLVNNSLIQLNLRIVS